jgi:glycosyltransferase involved in cell wall biosynthesis
MYQALDLYLITSRQEGGPKAVLESMASGIPLVSTRVGQGMDLIAHGRNGWVVDVSDIEALANSVLEVYGMDEHALSVVLAHGRVTSEANSYESQIPLWSEFMKGFVACNSC